MHWNDHTSSDSSFAELNIKIPSENTDSKASVWNWLHSQKRLSQLHPTSTTESSNLRAQSIFYSFSCVNRCAVVLAASHTGSLLPLSAAFNAAARQRAQVHVFFFISLRAPRPDGSLTAALVRLKEILRNSSPLTNPEEGFHFDQNKNVLTKVKMSFKYLYSSTILAVVTSC